MPDILETIAAATRKRVEKEKAEVSLDQVKAQAEAMPMGNHSFYQALAKPDISFICECKQASPSKGQIVDVFPYVDIAKDYEQAGADAISVLTEPQWFKGKLDYLQEISSTVSIPCLRKDFTIDPYMIYQAKMYGASAVLLIVSILDPDEIKAYFELAESLGMDALVECHDEKEVEIAKAVVAKIIGINNRNLRNFSVDSTNCLRLRQQVGTNCLFVAESGVKNHVDIQKLEDAQVNAVLIGETMMKAPDKKAMLERLKYGQN